MKTPQIILSTLRNEPTRWFRSYELNQQNTPYGYIGSAGSRRARDLASSGKIEVRHFDESGNRLKYSEYRFKPSLADRVIARANDYQPMNLKLI